MGINDRKFRKGNQEWTIQILWNHFYSFFVSKLIHEIKNPMNNETWELVCKRVTVSGCFGSKFDFHNRKLLKSFHI
jgi:hypothetical protein